MQSRECTRIGASRRTTELGIGNRVPAHQGFNAAWLGNATVSSDRCDFSWVAKKDVYGERQLTKPGVITGALFSLAIVEVNE